VAQAGLADDATRVEDDGVDYYGRRYWLEHQSQDLGLPDIYSRARLDLPERCADWLEALLRYRRPPARVLEVGAGSGAYAALLSWAGFDATALDLSPWVAEFARERFGIEYLVGAVEEQALEPRSFDVVIANDVLEHLSAPAASVATWIHVLKPNGAFVFQTPKYDPDRSYPQLVAENDPFLEHIGRARHEHLYLFSVRAVTQLLRDVGLQHVVFEEPVYPYDMFGVASGLPLSRADEDIDTIIGTSPTAPLVIALLDAREAWRISERDRADRLEVIERLDEALKESEADRAERLAVIHRLDAALSARSGPGELSHERERTPN
jgi:2-polyprenyl-3-methyl-5-hydroxy-6-metoxy-1,4-benzoquinol methylase